MANTQDFTTVFKDMMNSFPVDTKSMEGMMKNQAALTEKMSAVALDAAKQSTDLSAKWTQDTLAKVSAMTSAKSDPADYAKSVTDFVTASAEAAAEHMAAFAEIAKRMQTESLELMLSAGKDFSEEASAVAKKATTDMTAAAKKAAAK